MEAWLALMPEDVRTQPFVGLAAGGETLSPEDMISEVRNGTELGDRFLDAAIGLMAAKDLQQRAIRFPQGSDTGRFSRASDSGRVLQPTPRPKKDGLLE